MNKLDTDSRRILIIDGNTRQANEEQEQFGGQGTGLAYAGVLSQIQPDWVFDVVHPAYPGYRRLSSQALSEYRGVAITGSALHVYDATPEVQNQLDLVAEAFDLAIPVFGSCWGLQLGCVALGGRVEANPLGRELAAARGILLSDAGRAHPMYAAKKPVFDALAIHTDEVVQMPPGATLLAGNEVSRVQALAVVQGEKVFWGVQYHPEFSLRVMAILFRRYYQSLAAEGYFGERAQMQLMADDFTRIEEFESAAGEGEAQKSAREACKALCWRYGIDRNILDFGRRTQELANWLNFIRNR